MGTGVGAQDVQAGALLARSATMTPAAISIAAVWAIGTVAPPRPPVSSSGTSPSTQGLFTLSICPSYSVRVFFFLVFDMLSA